MTLVEVKVSFSNITGVEILKYLLFSVIKYQKNFPDIECMQVLEAKVKAFLKNWAVRMINMELL